MRTMLLLNIIMWALMALHFNILSCLVYNFYKKIKPAEKNVTLTLCCLLQINNFYFELLAYFSMSTCMLCARGRRKISWNSNLIFQPLLISLLTLICHSQLHND